jgi:hypothetical protein
VTATPASAATAGGAAVPRGPRGQAGGRRACRGQASIEALAVVPALLLAAALAWWLAAAAATALRAEEDVRRAALRARGAPGATVTVRVRAPTPGPPGARVVLEPVAAVRLP